MNTMKLPTGEDVTQYIAAVRAELADLPPDDLDDLTGGLEADLSELVAESPSGLAGLASPQEYAAELRSAAGFPVRAEQSKPTWWSQQKDLARRDLANLAADYPAVRQARDLAIELRPVWWIARGVALAWLLVIWGSVSMLLYPLAIIGAVVSVYVGRRGAELVGWPRRLLMAANAVAVLGVVFALGAAIASSRGYVGYNNAPYPEPMSEPGLQFNGTPSSNLYVYDKDGKPVTDVRIFTDTGQSVDLAGGFLGPDGSPLHGPADIYGHPWDNTFPLPTDQGAGVDTNPDVWTPPSAIPPLGTAATAASPTTAPTGSPSGTVTTPGGAATTMPTTSPPVRPTSSLPVPTTTN
ncbi:hypothetical protein [Pedococcus bigeumensis]|uniref:Uncharacterized protein n=1 Tax=Pedococcus bigeumensis TaxID=433644 RepID=A0A502D0D0_9MICO|nr:hypothetical protein [Pedococcus bigeumensis]TPG18987.1 hypothetical protein EAH86_00150 [Pedococcus bigeumensis]